MDTDVYNHLTTEYMPKPLNKYDTHKASELRSIVSEIVKNTQTSPRYLIKMNQAKQNYVLGVKEAAIMLQNGLAELTDESAEGVFSKRKAYSSDVEKVSAEIVTENYERLPEPFSLEVKHLATTQVNLGKEWYANESGIAGGTYRFRANVGDDYYDFQYNVRKGSNHRDLLKGLSSFINKANIGLNASIVPVRNSQNRLQMRIESTMTGSVAGERIFNLSDKDTPSGNGLVEFYGLDQLKNQPTSSTFYMDGVEKHTLSNKFTIGKTLQLDLRAVTDNPIKIQYLPDSDLILGGVHRIVDAYNTMVDKTNEYSETTSIPMRLIPEIKHQFSPYISELESAGISFNEDDKLQIDKSLAIQAINEGDMKELFNKSSGLVHRLKNKTDEVKLNPMIYVDKTLVTYPDPSKPATGSSYVTSLYSGLLFNFYF